jgi:signal transduction histidine kinase
MKKIKIKLVYKLMASYILIFMIMAVAISLSNTVISSSIDQYFAKRTEAAIEEIGSAIEEELITEEQMLELENNIRNQGDAIDIEATFYNQEDEIIYEISEKKKEEAGTLATPPEGVNVPDRFLENIYSEKAFDVTYENGESGTLVIGYFHRGTLNENDYFLIERLANVNRIIIIGIVVVGIIVSVVLSRSITKPIYKVRKTANEIRKGNLQARTSISTSTLEIDELSQSIDYLGDTLEKEDMLRRQMTSDMAHEIRTPLTTIRNFFEAFIDGVWEANEENMTICYNELLRLSNLIDKLKDISNIEETNLKMNNQHFDLSDEINQIAELFRPQFYKKNMTIDLEIQENISVYMDKNIFSQIIGNIISNAYRYTDQGGHVLISAKKDEKQIIIKIKDNGIGIDAKDLPFIFERFYRTEKSRNRETGGMGVGLTIVKKLVETYKGRITIESEVDQGTMFTIAFDNKSIT